MNLFQIYKIGERLMTTIPILGNLHHKLSDSILSWCHRHNFVRFDNLRSPNSTPEDVKTCTAFWFCFASFFMVCGIYQLFYLHITAVVFFLMLAFVPYAIGVINLEALKIEPKITQPFLKESNYNKTNKDAPTKNDNIILRCLAWGNRILWVWLFYIVFWRPEKIPQWVEQYNLYDYVEKSGIKETNVAGVFALSVFLAYIILTQIVMFLLKLLHLFKKQSVQRYSLDGVNKYNQINTKK